jgi:DNA-binding SARP family transcriptional activator
MQMWLSLLGPLRVEMNGARRDVSAPLQRILLATLAISANTVVQADRLADALWETQPPPSKTDTTRTYIHRLRACLGPEIRDRIATRAPGYMLLADSQELDLLKFGALVREGRGRFEASDWPGASALLLAAEGLWRGNVLADIPARHAHERYIRYLEQTRLAATEVRLEAEIRQSRHKASVAIPELEDIAARHPEREGLRRLLMLALFRAGRHAEALSVFTRARRASIEEFGLEPGSELAEMQKRIFDRDPRLKAEPLGRLHFA